MRRFFLNILEIILVIFLAVSITTSLFIYYKGRQPLSVPEARGISFWQLIKERRTAWREADAKISELPGYTGCENNILQFGPINFRSSLNYTYACLFPNSETANAFQYWEDRNKDPILPRVQPISWFDAPDFFWNYFERAYWRGLVSIDYKSGPCSLGPVDFDEIFAEGD